MSINVRIMIMCIRFEIDPLCGLFFFYVMWWAEHTQHNLDNARNCVHKNLTLLRVKKTLLWIVPINCILKQLE